jgi:Spy/CpxP family protein refolding chaperone
MTVMFNPVTERTSVMKTWIKRTLIGALGATLLVGGLTACGSHSRHDGEWSAERMTAMRGKMVDKIGKKLALDATQKQKLDVLADQIIASHTAFSGKDTDPRAELQAMVAGAKFDRPRAQAMFEQKAQAVQGNGPQVISAFADFYDSLNTQQQQEVRERMQHRSGGWWRRG